MTLTDAGPLAALYLPGDVHHRRCVAALPQLSAPLVTTMPCFTEAMHFIGKHRGWQGQRALWDLVADGRLHVRTFDATTLNRMRQLMADYCDTPMDLADASVVALAEELGVDMVFTLDSHFRAYRMQGRTPFLIVPQPQ